MIKYRISYVPCSPAPFRPQYKKGLLGNWKTLAGCATRGDALDVLYKMQNDISLGVDDIE